MPDQPAATAAIPLVDLVAQHRVLRPEIDSALDRIFASSGFILGEAVEGFERDFAAYLGTAHAVGVASGTEALHLALRALGIGPGDEVIVPSWTFIATAAAVSHAGATPVFADIDPATYHLSPADTRARITAQTRAIIPVHLYGQALDLAPFHEIARDHGLRLVEDACQAHGARVDDGRRAGACGDVGCFSFYPSKNLGGIGDGGLVATDDGDLAQRIRVLRHHGQAAKNRHDVIGYTGRLDAVQAAVLGVKLPHLDAWNRRRQAVARCYDQRFADLPLGLPTPAPGHDHVFHLYVVRTPRRDALLDHLSRTGIGAAVHYPQPVHRQPAFAETGRRAGDLPATEAAAREVLSLPIYPELGEAELTRVAAAVREFFTGKS